MSETLTGKTRYRAEGRLFSTHVLILQVECKRPDGPPDGHGLPQYLAGTFWRDARTEDLSELGSVK